MNKKLMCLILGICLLLCIYLINLPLHKTTDDFDGKNIILSTPRPWGRRGSSPR